MSNAASSSPLVDPSRLLLRNELAPITDQLVFLECDPEKAAREFMKWRILAGDSPGSVRIREPLTPALLLLQPLTFLYSRHLFIPTKGCWTAYFNSYVLGTNVHTVVPALTEFLGCSAVHIGVSTGGPYSDGEEALVLNVFEGGKDLLYRPSRSIGLRNYRGWWRFWRLGHALSFEQVDRYRYRRRKRRFTFEMLAEYSAALGLSPFDEEFYSSDGNLGGHLITCSIPVK